MEVHKQRERYGGGSEVERDRRKERERTEVVGEGARGVVEREDKEGIVEKGENSAKRESVLRREGAKEPA